MSTYIYTKEEINELIKRDLERRIGIEENTFDELYQSQMAHFPDGSCTVMYSELNSESNNSEEVTESPDGLEVHLPEVSEVFNDHTNDYNTNADPMPERVEVEHPPHEEASSRAEIYEMISWAISNKQMLEMVYHKPRSNERSARIVTPINMEGSYVRTILHMTIRENTEVPEYTTADDNRRTFITNLIEKVRPTSF